MNSAFSTNRAMKLIFRLIFSSIGPGLFEKTFFISGWFVRMLQIRSSIFLTDPLEDAWLLQK